MEPENFNFALTSDLDDDKIAQSVEPEQIIALNSEETALEIVSAPVEATPQEPEQVALFEKGEWWEEHWKGMPEFVQKDLAPWKSIYVHFENRQDMESFSKLVGQQIGLNTRSIWYPEAEIARLADKRYIDLDSGNSDEFVEVLDQQ